MARKTPSARKPKEQQTRRTMLSGDVSPLARLVIITSVPRLKMSSMNLRVGSQRVGNVGRASAPRRSLSLGPRWLSGSRRLGKTARSRESQSQEARVVSCGTAEVRGPPSHHADARCGEGGLSREGIEHLALVQELDTDVDGSGAKAQPAAKPDG
jgi:hypothetical protein